MSQPLSPALAEALRKRAQAQKEASTNTFTRNWPLAGQKAIVPPGGSIVGRLLPRWDYAQSRIANPAGPGTIENPEYNKDAFPNVEAIEHWWDNSSGKRTRAYCPKTLNPNAACVVHIASEELRKGSAEDKKLGKDISGKKVYVYNAVFDYLDPKKTGRMVDQTGLVDIRIVSCGPTLDRKINDIMTGGEKSAFARGNIMHPAEGYDLLFKRPAAQGQEWDVSPSPEPSPLYDKATQAAAFKNWVGRMINLQEMLEKEVPDEIGMFKLYYEREPTAQELDELRAPAPLPGAKPAVRAPISDEADPPVEAAGASSAPPVSPDGEFDDDDFMPKAGATAGRAPRR